MVVTLLCMFRPSKGIEKSTSIQLTKTEFMILWVLLENSPRVVMHTALNSLLFRDSLDPAVGLRVHIHKRRSAIDRPFGTTSIQTNYMTGYRFEATAFFGICIP
jgi:DNA-binding response OmpR family regulator